MNDVPETLTIKQVAAELKVRYITALNYVRFGKMRGIRQGGQWRVTVNELERFRREGNLPTSAEEDAHSESKTSM